MGEARGWVRGSVSCPARSPTALRPTAKRPPLCRGLCVPHPSSIAEQRQGGRCSDTAQRGCLHKAGPPGCSATLGSAPGPDPGMASRPAQAPMAAVPCDESPKARLPLAESIPSSQPRRSERCARLPRVERGVHRIKAEFTQRAKLPDPSI